MHKPWASIDLTQRVLNPSTTRNSEAIWKLEECAGVCLPSSKETVQCKKQ